MSDFPRCPKCGGILNYGMKNCPSCEQSGVIIRNTGKPGNALRSVKRRYLGELQYAVSIIAFVTLIVSLFFPMIKIPLVGEMTIFNIPNAIVPISWAITLVLLGHGVYRKDCNLVLFIGVMGLTDSVARQFYKTYLLGELVGNVKDVAGNGMMGDMLVGATALFASNVTFGAGYYISVVAFGMLLFAGLYEREKNFYTEHTTESVSAPFIRIIIFSIIGTAIGLSILAFCRHKEKVAFEKQREEKRLEDEQERIMTNLIKDPDMTWKCETTLAKSGLTKNIRSMDLRDTDTLNIEDIGDITGKISDMSARERKKYIGCIYYLAGLKKGSPLIIKVEDPVTREVFAVHTQYGYADSIPQEVK